MTVRCSHPVPRRLGKRLGTAAFLLETAVFLLAACSSQKVQQNIQTSARAVQPAVSAVECGGGSVKAAIEDCRAQGGHYGHCAVVASRAGYSSAKACYTYSADIHRRREQLVGQEGALDAEIRYLQGVNADTERLNAELGGKIEEVTVRTNTAVESLKAGQMTEAEVTQLQAILDHEVSEARKQLEVVSQELESAQQYRARRSGASSAELDAEIAQLQSLLAQIQRGTRALSAQRDRI